MSWEPDGRFIRVTVVVVVVFSIFNFSFHSFDFEPSIVCCISCYSSILHPSKIGFSVPSIWNNIQIHNNTYTHFFPSRSKLTKQYNSNDAIRMAINFDCDFICIDHCLAHRPKKADIQFATFCSQCFWVFAQFGFFPVAHTVFVLALLIYLIMSVMSESSVSLLLLFLLVIVSHFYFYCYYCCFCCGCCCCCYPWHN